MKATINTWIKTPYPGEAKGEGVWTLCTTPWMKRLAKRTKLPVREQEKQPEEQER